MKKKFSLWLNIVTICLCVCAIAIGVYAATNATLTINGQIGFQAHGCDVDASGYMYGYATLDANQNEMPVAQPTTTAQKEALALSTTTEADQTPNIAEVRGSNAQSLTLGKQNFTDINSTSDGKPTDIVIVLTLKNQSLFDIYGVVSATSDSPNIGIKKSVGLFNLGKKVGTTVKSIDIEITLSIFLDVNKNYNDVTVSTDNIHISIDFNKGKVEDNLIKKDTTNNYYYVEMGTEDGTATGTPLRWYAFAKDGVTHSKSTALTTGSYYFISEKALLVNYSEDMGGWYAGVAWGACDAEATDKGVDYAHESAIRPIVNDGANNPNSVYSTYGMAGNPIYNAITNRDLDAETYRWYYDADEGDYENYKEYTTNKTYNQTLWLLSDDEANNHFAEEADRMANPAGGATSDYACWWLRSPIDADCCGVAYAWCVYEYGTVGDGCVVDAVPGVRPAFQIDIDLSGGTVVA